MTIDPLKTLLRELIPTRPSTPPSTDLGPTEQWRVAHPENVDNPEIMDPATKTGPTQALATLEPDPDLQSGLAEGG